MQYADYAVWQREQLGGEVLDRQLSYWRERLAGAPELLELPTDHPRPAVQSYRGTREAVELPGELLERLRALGRSEGATLYMTLLGAFQVLLSKYSGGEDVVVGSPIAGRTRREVEELIGFFVNTLVLRTDLSGDPSFRETLRRVRDVTLGAYENQELPFERLVAELQPERSLSHSPLFQVLFQLQNAGDAGTGIPGVRTGSVESVVSTTQFDLHLAFAEGPGGLRAVLTYSTDLFERSTMRADAGAPGAGAGAGRGERGTAPLAAAGDGRGGAPSGAGGVERDGGRLSRGPLQPRAVRGAGGAHAQTRWRPSTKARR